MSPTCLKQKRPHPPELKRTKSQGTRKLQKAQSVASVDEPNGGGAFAQPFSFICYRDHQNPSILPSV